MPHKELCICGAMVGTGNAMRERVKSANHRKRLAVKLNSPPLAILVLRIFQQLVGGWWAPMNPHPPDTGFLSVYFFPSVSFSIPFSSPWNAPERERVPSPAEFSTASRSSPPQWEYLLRPQEIVAELDAAQPWPYSDPSLSSSSPLTPRDGYRVPRSLANMFSSS